MGRAYSQDLRDRVIAGVEDGLGVTACARLMRVSVSYVSKVLGRKRSTGETAARPLGQGPEPKLAGYEAALRKQVTAEPDATLEELCGWLRTEHGVEVSVSGLCRTLQRLELPRKKSRSTRANKTDLTSRPRVRRGGKRSQA